MYPTFFAKLFVARSSCLRLKARFFVSRVFSRGTTIVAEIGIVSLSSLTIMTNRRGSNRSDAENERLATVLN